MRTNLELKAKYRSAAAARSVSLRLGAKRKGILRQVDTYFRVRNGRLKLRQINGNQYELIYYHRKDRKGTRYSDFFVVPLNSVRPMMDVCKEIFGVLVVVRKRRDLFVYENARIHIDSVKGLGSFIEFEVIVNRGRRQAEKLMSFLITEFVIGMKDMIAGSYSDMLGRRTKRHKG